MNEVKITYNRMSPEKQRRVNRLTMFSAGIGLILSVSESMDSYSGILLVLPILLSVVGTASIIFAVKYDLFKDKFQGNIDVILLRVNGLTYLITGLNFQFTGGGTIQYVYYALVIAFLFVLPRVFKNQNKSVLIMRNADMSDRRIPIFPPGTLQWPDINSVFLSKDVLEFKLGSKNKSRKYHLNTDSTESITDLTNELRTLTETKKIELVLGNPLDKIVISEVEDINVSK